MNSLFECYSKENVDIIGVKNQLELFNIEFIKHIEQNPGVNKHISSAVALALELNKKYNLFPMITKVYRLFLTAPPSVFKSERSFSHLKLLKNYFRNAMGQKHLHYLMLLSCEKTLQISWIFNAL